MNLTTTPWWCQLSSRSYSTPSAFDPNIETTAGWLADRPAAGFLHASHRHTGRRQGWLWSCAPMELCCREGPDGGMGPRGKNPRKWLALPASSGLPLNGCMPRVAWQKLGASSSRSKSTSTSRHAGCGSNNGPRRVVVVRLLLQPTPPAAAAMERDSTRPGTGRRGGRSSLSAMEDWLAVVGGAWWANGEEGRREEVIYGWVR